ncbi:MAG: hypothetical protein KDK91_07615 [Gammaproteobacteria bacterium]|nr:hypothetical protein [Gammaproteobacteria bacterium]
MRVLARGLCWALLCVIATHGHAQRLPPTTPTHTGPWYQPGAPLVRDLWQPGMPGTRLSLRGRVLNTQGQPLADTLVEFWHTDAAGSYPPLRGSVRSGADGGFTIRTILPGVNLGYRARHIHLVLTHPAQPRLVTRIYFLGDENMDEAPWPELAITLEESVLDGERRLYGNILLVMAGTPRSDAR